MPTSCDKPFLKPGRDESAPTTGAASISPAPALSGATPTPDPLQERRAKRMPKQKCVLKPFCLLLLMKSRQNGFNTHFCFGMRFTRPFAGTPGQTHAEAEVRIETILPAFHQQQVVEALLSAHPYEEPAYDLYPLHNNWDQAGFGVIGQLPKPQSTQSFLEHLKQVSGSGCVRHTRALKDQVQTIAVCGGSGSFLLNKAIAQKADVYVSGDFKYHQFFDAEGEIVIADIGHYESERFVKEVFFELLTKKFPNFAVRLSEQSSNPIKYL